MAPHLRGDTHETLPDGRGKIEVEEGEGDEGGQAWREAMLLIKEGVWW